MAYTGKSDGAWIDKFATGGSNTTNLIDAGDCNRWEANQLDANNRLTTLESTVFNVATYGATPGGTPSANATAINAAIAAATAGGTVYFPGIYPVPAATLNLKSNVRWLGDGMAVSGLVLANGSNGRMLSWSTAVSNVTFENMGFDFNKVNQSDGVNRDDRSGFQLTNVTNLRVIGCRFSNGRSGAALRLDTCNYTTITGGCQFLDNGMYATTSGSVTLPVATLTVTSTAGFAASGTLRVGSQTVTYTGSTSTTFTGCSGGTGAIAAGTACIPVSTNASVLLCDHNFNSNADHLRVVGNSYQNATDTGTAQDGIQHSAVVGNTYTDNVLAVSISNSTTRNSRWNAISANSVRGCGDVIGDSVGIKVSTFGSTTPGNMTDGTIVGNTVHNCDRALWVEECDRMVVANNVFADAVGRNKQLVLVATTGAASNIKMHSNILYNTSNRGVSFASTAVTNMDIVDNTFDTVTTPIGGTNPASVRILDNRGVADNITPSGGTSVGTAAALALVLGG